MPKDAAGISDGVIVELSGPGREVKGPVEFYVQTYETKGGRHTFRVVDRAGNVMSPVRRDRFDTHGKAATAARAEARSIDAVTEYERHPGESGGPPLPDDEGEPE